jgi:hypothetical protein
MHNALHAHVSVLFSVGRQRTREAATEDSKEGLAGLPIDSTQNLFSFLKTGLYIPRKETKRKESQS